MTKKILVLSICVLLVSGAEAATVRYSYQGGNYDVIDPGLPAGFNGVSAWFELSAPLPDNQPFDSAVNVTPTAWLITDGVNTITHETAGFELGFSLFGTDDGQITQWQFTARLEDTNGAEGLWFVSTSYDELIGVGMGSDRSLYCLEYGSTSCTSFSDAGISDSPGTWTVTQVPLPAALWMFASALAMLRLRKSD